VHLVCRVDYGIIGQSYKHWNFFTDRRLKLLTYRNLLAARAAERKSVEALLIPDMTAWFQPSVVGPAWRNASRSVGLRSHLV